MEVMEGILKRRSIRKYKDIPISKDVIGEILVASQWPPLAGNLQCYRIIVVDDEGLKDKIAELCHHQTWMKTAPVFMAVFADMEHVGKTFGDKGKTFYSLQEIGAAMQNILLAATANDLGSCWVGSFNDEDIRLLLGVPDNYRTQGIITLGYADETVPTPARTDLKTLVYYNGYGGSLRFSELDWFFKEYASEVQKGFSEAGRNIWNGVKDIIHKLHKRIKK